MTKYKEDWTAVTDKLKAMAIGDAFFLPYRQTKDVLNLYNLARRADLAISLRYLELDPEESKPGVRVTRIEPKKFDPPASNG